jgi:hypothetical protein
MDRVIKIAFTWLMSPKSYTIEEKMWKMNQFNKYWRYKVNQILD